MIAATNFIIALIFSFVGSIPPGTINLTAMRLGLEGRIDLALRFSLAAALMEYPYAWIAVKFAKVITSSPVIVENLSLAASLVMITLGIIYLWPPRKKAGTTNGLTISSSGFRRGIVIGLLNPLALPFWIGITAYLKSQRWIDTSTTINLHAYLLGIVSGAFLLLILLAYVGNKMVSGVFQRGWIKKIPGSALLGLGVYALVKYFLLP